MPKIRLHSINSIHQSWGNQTLILDGSEKSNIDQYLLKYGLHHLMFVDRKVDIQQRMVRLSFLSSYIDAWDGFSQALKICRVLGLKPFLQELSRTLDTLSPNKDLFPYFHDLLEFGKKGLPGITFGGLFEIWADF